jgi:hypothetical protein
MKSGLAVKRNGEYVGLAGMFSKALIILNLMCGLLYGAETNNLSTGKTNSLSAPRTLIEVIFANDDREPTQTFHTVIALVITDHNRGNYRFVYNWAAQGGSSPEPDAVKKTAECLKLLKSLDQPKKLPESQNHIVSVRCLDGDKLLELRFPIDQVPDEVHHILAIMGFSDDQFNRLNFIQKPGQAAFTNYIPSFRFTNGF